MIELRVGGDSLKSKRIFILDVWTGHAHWCRKLTDEDVGQTVFETFDEAYETAKLIEKEHPHYRIEINAEYVYVDPDHKGWTY